MSSLHKTLADYMGKVLHILESMKSPVLHGNHIVALNLRFHNWMEFLLQYSDINLFREAEECDLLKFEPTSPDLQVQRPSTRLSCNVAEVC